MHDGLSSSLVCLALCISLSRNSDHIESISFIAIKKTFPLNGIIFLLLLFSVKATVICID